MNGVATSTVMRNFLVISNSFSRPDQTIGDLHFYTLRSLLAHKHQMLFCALNADSTTQPRNNAVAQLECHECLTPYHDHPGLGDFHNSEYAQQFKRHWAVASPP